MNNGNSGPFRVPQPAERRAAASRPEPARTPVIEEPVAHEPVQRASSSRTVKEQPKKKPTKWILLLVGAIIVIALAWFAWGKLGSAGAPAIDRSKYQAVFFTNGQVYFGKLSSTGDYFKLSDVYYLQAQDADSSNGLQEASKTQSGDMQLIKLGGEIHGPEDEMIVSKGQVLFYENLKSDGKVSQSIKSYKK